MALKAARTAISVLPKPTSPQIRRSIGTGFSMSALTSSMVVSWSAVSWYGNASSSSFCHGVSGLNAKPGVRWRAEYSLTRSSAISWTCLRAFALVAAQSEPPSLLSFGASAPMYLLIWSSWSVGMNSLSAGAPRLLGAYSMTRYSRVVRLAPVPMVRWRMPTNRPMPCCSCTT